jgi:hypothetical protein
MPASAELRTACNFFGLSDITECITKDTFSKVITRSEQFSFMSIPTEIGLLTQMTHLSISGVLSGNIPSTIGNLILLKSLRLENRGIGTIPASFGNLVQLTTLVLQESNLIRPHLEVSFNSTTWFHSFNVV